ncbi:MAG: hypothetical protein HYY06_16305 [Deltaproteobacteria bacterium]|nr:hypothetical protein [Deltaproteobacteria bacterium]
MTRLVAPLFLIAACSSDPAPSALGREIVDCTAGDEVCETTADTGCSVRVGAPAADGGVAGGCADAGPRRVCTKHCEADPECPDGWTCQLPAECPGETHVSFCVPSGDELAAQSETGCAALADPRVCGFY